jgi:hypothetical protein
MIAEVISWPEAFIWFAFIAGIVAVIWIMKRD